MKKIFLILLILMCSFAYASDADKIIKIGLYYGGNALEEPQLQNFVGQGYDFGYFDSNNDFVKIYSTNNTKLLMKSDKSYNVAVKGTYNDIDDAQDDIKELKKAGVDIFIASVNNKIQIRSGEYATVDTAKSAMKTLGDKITLNLEVVSPNNNTITITDTDTRKPLFEYTKTDYNLGIMPVASKEKAQTWFKGLKYYGGFEYALKDKKITVINNVELGDYIKGVIPYEINPSWPVEAQKAQALCAKNYAIRSSRRHSSEGFDLCNTTHCQVYKGTSTATETSDKAVDDVIEESIYYNGDLAETFYYSSNGGASENCENVWTATIPYLVGVKDEFENDSIPNWKYEHEVTLTEIKNLLVSKGYSIGELKRISTELTDMGNIAKVIFTDVSGKEISFEKAQAKTILSKYVNSMRYNVYPKGGVVSILAMNGDKKKDISNTVNYAINNTNKKLKLKNIVGTSVLTSSGVKKISQSASGESADTYIIRGAGNGHNVGMSQWGARLMAEKGHNYKEILKYYFTGVEIK